MGVGGAPLRFFRTMISLGRFLTSLISMLPYLYPIPFYFVSWLSK